VSKIELDDQQLLRYSRHIMLPQMDVEGQQRLLNASVLLVGAGGLGSSAAQYLAASGIGELHINDFDHVDESNLQRQIIHREANIGMNKAESARQRLHEINSACRIHSYPNKLDASAIADIIENVDCVVDGSDNFATRFMLNELCVRKRKPLVSGAAIRLEGQLSVFDSRDPLSPCYRCLYQEQGEIEQTCSENGILAPVVGAIGCLQAVETIKVLSGVGKPLIGRLLLFDAYSMEWRQLNLKKDPNCPVCQST